MRSRYSAYVLNKPQYIYDTYCAQARSSMALEDLVQAANNANFVRLEVLDAPFSADTEQPQQVEFIAHYIENNFHGMLHERSNFMQENGAWVYVDGEIFPTKEVKLERNMPCPCGSKKKYKKCHG